MTIAAITEGLSWIVRTVKAALSRRAVIDLPIGEKLLKDTEASVAEVDKLAAGVVK